MTRDDRFDSMQDALQRILSWSEAYPIDIFPEPDWKRVRFLLRQGGISLDRVSGACMRRVVEGIGKIARDGLEEEQQ